MFLSIARSIADDILRGRLKPGAPLPGSRTLAASLGVHRNTVLAAYHELEAEGFTEATAARATRVSTELPRERAHTPRAQGHALDRVGFDLGPAQSCTLTSAGVPKGAISLFGGSPDLTSVPTPALARAYRRALRSPTVPLGYGDPQGEHRLRAALADMVRASRGLSATADDVLVTRGSQMALYLAARTLLSPGDVVLVEALGYRPAWEALRAGGAELVPVPVDPEGVDVEAVLRVVLSRRVRAIYLTPHHQYPTTRLLSQARRRELLLLAKRHRFAILEDDYDHEFHYDKKPVLPLASQDEAGVVVYFATLSKILAPGLRLGFVVAPRPVLERMTSYRALVDRQGDRVVELAVAELAEDGEIERHARRMRRVYAQRRTTFIDLLRRHLGGVLDFEPPAGGMAVWVHAPGVDVDAWAARAEAAGVMVQTAKRFGFDGRRRPFLRLGFAGEDERRLRLGVERLARSLPR